ncbi:unnamed protein product, partial [Vitis vinifera]
MVQPQVSAAPQHPIHIIEKELHRHTPSTPSPHCTALPGSSSSTQRSHCRASFWRRMRSEGVAEEAEEEEVERRRVRWVRVARMVLSWWRRWSGTGAGGGVGLD